MIIEIGIPTNRSGDYSTHRYDPDATDTLLVGYTSIGRTTRIYRQGNSSAIADSSLQDITIGDATEAFYNELLTQGARSTGSIIVNPTINGQVRERVIQRFFSYDHELDADSRLKLSLSDITKGLDTVYIENAITAGGDKATNAINSHANSLLGYDLLEEEILTTISPTNGRVKLSEYISQIASWCRIQGESNASQHILEWDALTERYQFRKLLKSTASSLVITYNHISSNKIKKQAGQSQVFNDIGYRYAGSTDSVAYSDTITQESLSLNQSKSISLNFQRLANLADAQSAVQSYARFLAQRRERVKMTIELTETELYNNPIALGDLLSLNIINNDFSVVGEYWIEELSIEPVNKTVDLSLVQKLSGDNF